MKKEDFFPDEVIADLLVDYAETLEKISSKPATADKLVAVAIVAIKEFKYWQMFKAGICE